MQARYAMTSASPLSLLELENWVEPFPRHWHEEWGIALIEQGVNRFWLGGGWHEAAAGAIIVVAPGEIHDGGLSREPWAERMTYVPVDVMETIAQTRPAFSSPIIHDDALAAALRSMHRTLSAGEAVEPFEADELQARTIGMLLSRYGSVRADERRDSGAIHRAKQLIRERVATPITLREIAAEVGMSLYHFIREFRAHVGMTPHPYLKQLRITIAQRLLSAGEAISDVALAAGFCDQSHLTREFRRSIGVTPGAFRKARRRDAGVTAKRPAAL